MSASGFKIAKNGDFEQVIFTIIRALCIIKGLFVLPLANATAVVAWYATEDELSALILFLKETYGFLPSMFVDFHNVTDSFGPTLAEAVAFLEGFKRIFPNMAILSTINQVPTPENLKTFKKCFQVIKTAIDATVPCIISFVPSPSSEKGAPQSVGILDKLQWKFTKAAIIQHYHNLTGLLGILVDDNMSNFPPDPKNFGLVKAYLQKAPEPLSLMGIMRRLALLHKILMSTKIGRDTILPLEYRNPKSFMEVFPFNPVFNVKAIVKKDGTVNVVINVLPIDDPPKANKAIASKVQPSVHLGCPHCTYC
jgi:hypothetical protein